MWKRYGRANTIYICAYQDTTENLWVVESGFTLDKMMRLYLNFYKLPLTHTSYYIKFPEWIAKRKTVINSKNNNEECFELAAVAALHPEVIWKKPERYLSCSMMKISIKSKGLLTFYKGNTKSKRSVTSVLKSLITLSIES